MEPLNPATDGASANIVDANLAKLRELFPDAFTESSTEGEPRWRVDFDALREALGDAIEDKPERYSFTWNGKSRAKLIANTPTTATLRPCPEESVNWDTTKNLFIEGDNLEVLKLLQKSYHRKVKMIYIDPPYNTGKEFIYPDKFQDNLGTYLRYTGQTDEDGFKLSANSETAGRYHTNWLSMMWPRIKLAKSLLSDDGVMFITIDDNERANLRRLCDEIFGEENFLADIAWKHTQQSKNDEKYFSRQYNSILVYRKSAEAGRFRFPRTEQDNKNYSNPDGDPRGEWRSGDVRSPHLRRSLKFVIPTPSGKTIDPPENGWRWSEDEVHNKIESGEIMFNDDETRIIRKIYLDNQDGRTPENVWHGDRFGTTRQANAEIKGLFDGKAVFDTPKPVALVERMCDLIGGDPDCTVLDFFAGSCTTAHAVMACNLSDGGSRRFIAVQLPEPCEEKTEAFSSGFHTIAELGKERIRRCGASLSEQHRATLSSVNTDFDLGFRVFKLDSSSVQPWDADFENLDEELYDAVENVKADRSEQDVLYELLLKYGLDLAEPIDEREIAGSTVYSVGAGALVVCLSKAIDLNVVEGIVALKEELKPEVMRVVFRDSGFKDDVVKANAVQILKQAGLADEQIRSL